MIKFEKLFITFTLFVFLFSCGYTPIFSKKDVNFSIENIQSLGDRDVKKLINNALFSYKDKLNKEIKVSLILQNSKNTIVASRNSKGEALVYRIIILVKTKVILSEGNFIEKTFEKSGTYYSLEQKSKQKSSERKVVEDISNQIADQIILLLMEIVK